MAKYYVQDSRQFVGNCVLWWRKENAGYTTDIGDAAVFEEDELPHNRESDVPWPKTTSMNIYEKPWISKRSI